MKTLFLLSLLLITALGATLLLPRGAFAMKNGENLMPEKPKNYPVATFAGGCFWCLESEMRALDGILFTEVGYTGGDLDQPSYRDITTGKTGHAEAVEITYDPEKITYQQLVDFFLTKAHDPTQVNRQGVDVGTQYRSAIFTHDEAQAKIAHDAIARLTAEKHFKKPIATQVEPAGKFWLGEEYHQQYYEKYEEQTGQKHLRVLIKEKKKSLLDK